MCAGTEDDWTPHEKGARPRPLRGHLASAPIIFPARADFNRNLPSVEDARDDALEVERLGDAEEDGVVLRLRAALD